MTAWLVLLPLLAAVPAPEALGDADLEKSVEALLAEAEFQPLRRFREAAPTPPEPESRPSEPRTADSATPAPAPPAATPSPLDLPSLNLGGAAELLRLALYAALGLAVAWILFLVAAHLARRRSEPAVSERTSAASDRPAAPPGEQVPDEYLRQAMAHARAGRLSEAVRHLLLGAMSSLERRGLIVYRRGLTNGDYLRAANREPGLRAPLETIVREFDEVHFGRREATRERFEECLRRYRAGFSGP